jgi:hypothetical protein
MIIFRPINESFGVRKLIAALKYSLHEKKYSLFKRQKVKKYLSYLAPQEPA